MRESESDDAVVCLLLDHARKVTLARMAYAVIFTSRLKNAEGYSETSDRMVELSKQQPGFLGMESARGADGVGITVCYWQDLDSIKGWKANAEHQIAQSRGRAEWYESYQLRICRIESEHGFTS